MNESSRPAPNCHPRGPWRFARTAFLAFATMMASASLAAADCNCADSDGDGYPDSDKVCSASIVSQTSPYPGEKPAQTPAEISVTFDKAYACGQYINGDYWIVEPSPGTGVTIIATTPTFESKNEDDFGARWKHGWMVDPVRIDHSDEAAREGQSFDQRVSLWLATGDRGQASTSNPLPLNVSAGSSFIKAHSKPVWGGTPKSTDGKSGCQSLPESKGGPGGGTQSCIRAFMVVTMLDKVPDNPSDTFRPPYVSRWDRVTGARDPSWKKPGTGGKKGYRFADIRWNAFPKLDHTKAKVQSLYINNMGNLRDTFRLPQVEIHAHNQQRRLKAFDSSSGGPLYSSNGGDYAPHWARVTNRAWLRFTGNDVFPNPTETGYNKVHKQALVNLLQFGIDQLHLVIDADKMYTADGGHYAGGYLPALMACHLFTNASPMGYDVSPECAWLERNKEEGNTVDVGFPMWGELTFSYRTPFGLNQQAICSELPGRSGHTCQELGIDPMAAKPLYGQLYAQRPYTDAQKSAGGQGSCLGNWSKNVSPHCRDPYQIIDHSGNACHPDPDQVTSNYERIIQPNMRHVALIARLFGVFREDGSGPFPNHLWDFAARRYWLGYETLPDAGQTPGSNPTGYTGGANRCPALHHQHACAEGMECYPTLVDYGPICWSCLSLMDDYATYVHDMAGGLPPAGVRPTPPVQLP